MKFTVYIAIALAVCVGCSNRNGGPEGGDPFRVTVRRGEANQPAISVEVNPPAQGMVRSSAQIRNEADKLLFHTQGYIQAQDDYAPMFFMATMMLGELSTYLGEKAEAR